MQCGSGQSRIRTGALSLAAMKCPNCGSESSGTFCAECGAPLKGARCRECDAALPAGANFCTSCGASVHGKKSAAAARGPWIFAGVALVLLVVVLMWPSISGRESADNAGKMPLTQVQGIAGDAAGDDDSGPSQAQLSGTPREQADRLFNRIMTEREKGDTARAKFFLPMGIEAYQMAGDLDADGLYHLSLLQSFGGDYKAARATAEKVLAIQPNHLLALSAAANAARAAGDNSAAHRYYKQFLAAYDSELKTGKEEYQDHARVLPELKKEAEQYE